MAVGTIEKQRLNHGCKMNTVTTITQTRVNQLRTEAKQRSKTAALPLHICLEQIAKENGFPTWKQVLIQRELTPLDASGKTSTNDAISPGVAFLGLHPSVLEEVRHFQQWLLGAGVAEANHNTLRGDVFIDVTIEGHRFQGAISSAPYVSLKARDDGWAVGDCALGVASIAFAKENIYRVGGDGQWSVCKYENQPHIDLSGLSDAARRRLALEFGLPILGIESGIVLGHPAYFYASKGYRSLVEWAVKHPRKIKQYRGNGYLGHWGIASMLDAGIKPNAEQQQVIEASMSLLE